MAKRRRTTRRAVKRSAKRSAKRGAYKSRKTHLKSRGRTQRGGEKKWYEMLNEKAEAAAAAAREKAEAAGSYLTPLKEKAQGVLTDGLSNVSAGTAVINVGVAIANIIPKIFNAVFSLMVMVYILSTIARNPTAFAGAAKEELIKKLADLRERMKGLPGLKDCINIFESKIQTQVTMSPPSPPPPESNVGKTCIYSPGIATTKGTLSYQALIVGEWDQAKATEYDYDKPQYLIWVNGGGLDPEYVSKDREDIIKIVSNEEDEKEFNKLEGNRIGQQNVTTQQAREYYSLTKSLEPTDGPAPPIILPEQQETIVDMLKRRATEFSKATDKKQFIVGAVNGYIAASKLMLERFTERLNDEELKKCILRIKEALTQQIKTQVAELKSKLSGISDSDSDSEVKFQNVFNDIIRLGEVFYEGLRYRATGFFGRGK